MSPKRILLSWSGGKDCAWALHLLRSNPAYEVVALVTTINQHFHRVAMHGLRESLLDLQAEAAGLPVWKIPLPWPCSNEQYEAAMASVYARAAAENLHGVAFGDLFLTDVRIYREQQLAPTSLAPIFPCWGLPTADLARTMIASGLEARLICIDPCQIDPSFAGRIFDASLLADLPSTADPCGERGEFHTYVTAGPMFTNLVSPSTLPQDGSRSITVRAGDTVHRDGFCYADLHPV